ncbi:zinc finger protein ZFPM1 isoform X2 [Scyliorhinus canicula]|uniref:zinc finger protein ZFPM1 isoform X2 n=1 Tax=Scyliorhinus canicula TaxID=7830 RepID=UPI0018F70341|nr:zinc finger protein ZFPM1 isoform X2 [Scyliorhinus canicula]
MSRRKQSNPRQIKREFAALPALLLTSQTLLPSVNAAACLLSASKRPFAGSVGEMEEGEENLTGDSNMSEREAIASSHDESADCDTSSSFYSEDQGLQDVPKTPEEQEVMWSTGKRKDSELWQMSDQGLQDVPKTPEEQEVMWSTGKRKDSELWQMPESLELHHLDNEMQVRACQSLAQGLSWGPYEGSINSSNKRTLESDNSCVTATLQLKDKWCWLRQLKVTVNEESANCTIDCKDNLIWCKTTKPITEGECLTTIVGQSNSDPVLNLSVKMEPVESAECSEQPAMYPASLHSDIQLLPQQAGMAAILATAVVNKDIFPCKSCGIWYRSERNLQAHLMYYCASRQKSASTPTEEKLKDPSPPERVCPFPQCNKSCPSASSLEIHVRSHSGVCHGCGFVSTTRDMLYSHLLTNHMACQSGSKGDSSSPRTGTPALPLTGVKVANPFLSLKCNQCEYVGDSESNLQQHVLLHVVQDTFLCNQCHEKLRSAAELAKHMEIHQDNASQHSMEETKDRDDERPPALNKDLSEGLDMVMKVKEEPLNLQYESEGDRSVEEGQTHPTPDRSSDVSSPRSTLIAKVKSECSSPTPASSLVHSGTASVMPEGTVLIPYMFSQETSTFPQASEILAKMSELVHSRLKQGANNYPLLYAGAPIQKGATCYECDITFNNINNYLAHKRLYCYSRHQQAENSTVDDTVKDSAPMNRNEPVIHSPTSGTENQNASSSQADSERDLRIPNIESKTPEIKNEDSATKDTSSEGESLSRVSEGSRSPSNSVEDFDDDPSKTVCEACNIRFTRHETYAVHKRLYCASRHDPPVRRPNGGKAAILQQTVRTRKRRKLFEIHGTSHQPLPPPSPSEISVHSPSTVILESAGLSNNVEALKIKQKALSLSSRSSDSLSLSTGYILTTQSSTTSPPGSSSDVDGPIDLSKKPRIKEEPLIHVTPLRPASHFSTDYHECTSCKISFNNVENYLTHKKYYCSATALQHIKVEHLARVKMQASASTKAKKNRMEIADPPIQTEELKNKDINTKCIPESPNVVHGSITPNNSPGMYHSTPDVSQDGPPLSPHVKTFSAPQRTHSVICPYCPLNGPIEGDLIDHFKNAHELLLAKQLSTGHTAEGLMHDISSPGKPMTNSISEISPQNSIVPAPSLKSVAQKEKTTPNAKDQRESVSSQSSVESPLQNISPKPLATSSPNVALKILPVPESPRNVGFKSLSPSMNVDKSVQTAMSLPSPVQNGNHRYCRLCNIKFSSLSTFIAHKKYYCSSHTAEHVK